MSSASQPSEEHQVGVTSQIEEFNANAKAECRYDGRAFWEVPPRPGSILDGPESAESRERVAWLLQRIAELKGDAAPTAAAGQEMQKEAGDATQEQFQKEKAAG